MISGLENYIVVQCKRRFVAGCKAKKGDWNFEKSDAKIGFLKNRRTTFMHIKSATVYNKCGIEKTL